MADWKCTNCGYTFQAVQFPDKCPNCNTTCEFVDVTCYIPECGGVDAGNQDERLGRKKE